MQILPSNFKLLLQTVASCLSIPMYIEKHGRDDNLWMLS